MKASVHSDEIMRDITLAVELVGSKKLRVRVWLGAQVIKFAAWIMGCGIEIRTCAFFDPDRTA